MEKPVSYEEWMLCIQTAVLAARLQYTMAAFILTEAMKLNLAPLTRAKLYQQTCEFMAWHIDGTSPSAKPEWVRND